MSLGRSAYPFGGRQQFDVILFSDMLEHLTDPLDVLTRHCQLLAPGGQVLISLPNVAIWNVRLALLLGQFEYGDTGTLDRTHMRFFTRRSFRRFLSEAGLTVSRNRITPGMLAAVRPFDQASLWQGIGNGPAGRFLLHHGLGALPLLYAMALSAWNAGSAACGLGCWPSSS